ncbi:hypothetical protein OAG24_00225 [bacterium]|nr:hypothetical protein [bacterium]
MQGRTIALITIIILILILIAVAVWIWFIKNPLNPPIDCTKSGWAWDPSCLFFKENFSDGSLIAPDNEIYLVGFKETKSSAVGPPLCIPMWYRFRYVNVNTGGYGPLSKWTSGPVRSGGIGFPCIRDSNNECPAHIDEGKKSCDFNHPIVGVKDLHYDPRKPLDNGDFVWTNIHRFDGGNNPPPDNEEGKIVGYLYPASGLEGVKYIWNDIFFNPCKDSNDPVCLNRCKGC